MRRLGEGFSRETAFWLLMPLSALLLLLPPGWTDWMRGVTQLLVPAQAVVQALGVRATDAVSHVDQAVRPTGADAAPDLAALRNQLAFHTALVAQLTAENDTLRGLRAERIRRPLRLIPARVVSRDIVAARDSVLLKQGSARGVRWADWVVSRLFIDRGADAELEEGYTILAREYVVGRVEAVHPYMARVRLFSDLDCRAPVRVMRHEGSGLTLMEYPLTLVGLGGGRMVLREVPIARVVVDDAPAAVGGEARIAVGDVVVSSPGEFGLETPMVVGTVARIVVDPRKRLVADVEVTPAVSPDDLREVYVVAALAGAAFEAVGP